MTFGEALEIIKKGGKCTREGWNGKNQFICLAEMLKCDAMGFVLINPGHAYIGSKFIMFVGTSGCQCGWLASQADMLAEDWKEV